MILPVGAISVAIEVVQPVVVVHKVCLIGKQKGSYLIFTSSFMCGIVSTTKIIRH